MLDLVDFGAEKIQLFILLSLRTAGVIATAPIFSHRTIPRRVAVSMTLGLGLILLPLMVNIPLPPCRGLIDLTILCLKELLTGALIGIVFSVLFLGVQLAGSIVGYQIGFAMVNVVDPNSTTQVSILAEFWFLVATLIFLALDGHHMIISALFDSFRIIPLGAAPAGRMGDWFIKYTAFVFVLALKLAAPVILTIFLTEVGMGIMARTMPQMNIFIVGFPLKIFAGLFMVGASLPVFEYVLKMVCRQLDTELAVMMKFYHLAGAV